MHMLDWRMFKELCLHDLICEWNLWMLQYFVEVNLSVKYQNVLFNFSNRVSGPVYTDPDKFLHGRILFLDCLFTWIRANSVAVVFTRICANFWQVAAFELIPGHNCAIWAQSCAVRVFTRVHTNMELCLSKSWPAFFRSQTCTLSGSKIRPVLPVPCKRKVEPCKFLSMQRFVRTRVKGASECSVPLKVVCFVLLFVHLVIYVTLR